MSNGNELKKASIADLPCLKIGQKQCLCEISCEDCIESHVLAEGYRKQSGWISADNPPETYRDEYGELIPFLVCCRGTVHPFRAMYDGKNWGDGIGRLNVTHWMPLPEPPKGD